MLEAATAAGVLVMNTPGGNAVSVAEHTLALMLAMARSHSAGQRVHQVRQVGKEKFLGSELRGKTLGIVGLGSIGREVVKRARGVSRCESWRTTLMSPRRSPRTGRRPAGRCRSFTRAERLHHAARRTDSRNRRACSTRDAFAQMKKGVRIVNCARGELVDEEALRKRSNPAKWPARRWTSSRRSRRTPAIRSSRLDNVIATPHIGGSTEEAQEIVGVRIAEQIVEYLQNGVALNAVNMPALTPEQYRDARSLQPVGGAAGQICVAHLNRESENGALAVFRQDRRAEHAPGAECGAGGSCCSVRSRGKRI